VAGEKIVELNSSVADAANRLGAPLPPSINPEDELVHQQLILNKQLFLKLQKMSNLYHPIILFEL
jgi:hypothetical protein